MLDQQSLETQSRCRALDIASVKYEEAKQLHQERPSKHTSTYLTMRRSELDRISDSYNRYLEFTN